MASFSKLCAVPILLFATSASAVDCPNLCSNGSADCLIVKSEISNADAKAGLNWLHQIFARPADQTIKSSDLLVQFKMTDDPCHRSDTSVTAAGSITNTGEECKVGGDMALSGGTLSAHILVPKELSLSYSSVGGLVVVDTHAETNVNTDKSPIALFSDPSFQEDWGGVVKKVWFDKDQSILETRACIRFIY
ncbi:hypothetical protein ACU8OH_09220 [Rhizobium leguminosarum]